MELYFVGGKSLCLCSGESRFEIKRKTERRGNICGKLRAGKKKNIYKKKKKQGHVMEETENKNTYRTPFCQVISKKRRRFVTPCPLFSPNGTCVCLSGNFR